MKKKLSVMILALTLLLPGTGAFAADSSESADGGVIGHIYSTDILTYVNGEPIDAYNIGGKTVVIAEDLGDWNYGYTYDYNDEERLLSVESYFYLPWQEHGAIPRGQTGQILGDVYQTDIKVTYNGIEVTGYNIGGRTAICIEEIGDTAGSPHEAYGYSKYLAYHVWNPAEKTISLYSYFNNIDDMLGNHISRVAFTFADNVLYATADDDVPWGSIFPSVNGIRTDSGEDAYTYYYTEEFGDQKYEMSPLYLDIGGSRTEIGTCVAVWEEDIETDRTYLQLDDPAAAISLAASVKTPAKTYDEAMAFLTEKYELKDRIDNDNYTVLLLNDENKNDLVYAVKKTGGYAKLSEWAAEYDKTVGILFGEDEHEVIVTVHPYTDPHGKPTTLHESHRLDLWYNFD